MKKYKSDLDKYIEKAQARDPFLEERLEEADRAWNIAFQVHDLRKAAGLTQTQLAKLVGTRQSNIARVESADYTGYTLKTLEKITKALKAKLEVRIVPQKNNKQIQA